MKTLTLSREEKEFLDAYKTALDERFPGLVEDIIIYGSKARGDSGPDSDLDILLLIREGDWRTKRRVCEPAYDLAVAVEFLPSVMVYTVAEWAKRRESGSGYQRAVERDGVSVR